MARILLAGCGAIGTQLGEALQAAGHEVFGLRRSAVAMPFPTLHADLTQPLAAELLPAQLDYVVHTGTPAERSDSGYEAGYPRALRHLLAALAPATSTASLKRFFFVSSTAVYHQDDGSWVDETSPTRPTRFNGIRVLEAENVLRQSGVAGTCVRFGGIYGAGRNGLMRRVQAGAEVQVTPAKYTNRIHQDDCAGVLHYLINEQEQGRPLQPVYLAVDDDPADESTLCSWLADRLGAPAPVTTSPGGHMGQNKRCSNRLLRAQGYRFIYPTFREGYAAQCRVD